MLKKKLVLTESMAMARIISIRLLFWEPKVLTWKDKKKIIDYAKRRSVSTEVAMKWLNPK
jgi:hypothetical protein